MEFNLAEVFDTVARAVPDRECLVWRDLRLTYAQMAERVEPPRQLPARAGPRRHTRAQRAAAGHESGQDHLALYLYNGNEYLEGMLGAYKARVAPFNVNYRYVDEELLYLLRDANAKAIVYAPSFAATLAEVLPELPELRVLHPGRRRHAPRAAARCGRLRGRSLAAASPEPPPVTPSPDDLYILYTGGTTGMPKGVLWRQADIFIGAMGGRPIGSTGGPFDELRGHRRGRAPVAGACACCPCRRSCTAPPSGPSSSP